MRRWALSSNPWTHWVSCCMRHVIKRQSTGLSWMRLSWIYFSTRPPRSPFQFVGSLGKPNSDNTVQHFWGTEIKSFTGSSQCFLQGKPSREVELKKNPTYFNAVGQICHRAKQAIRYHQQINFASYKGEVPSSSKIQNLCFIFHVLWINLYSEKKSAVPGDQLLQDVGELCKL